MRAVSWIGQFALLVVLAFCGAWSRCRGASPVSCSVLSGSPRPPGHSGDVVLQGLEAIVNSSAAAVLELVLALHSPCLSGFLFLCACQGSELGVLSPEEAPYFILK